MTLNMETSESTSLNNTNHNESTCHPKYFRTNRNTKNTCNGYPEQNQSKTQVYLN